MILHNFTQFHLNFKDELIEVYSTRLIRAFAYSLIGVFIPIYLLNLGFSLQDVLTYLIFFYLTVTFLSPITLIIQKKIGVKHVILLSSFLLILFFVMLYTIQIYHWNLALLGCLFGLQLVLFWVPLNSYFGIHLKKGKMGEETSWLSVIPRISSILAPFLGAVIISYFSFNYLIILSSFLLLVSVFPLFITKDKFYEILPLTNFFSKHNRKYTLIFLSKGVLSGVLLLWPLFVYFTIKNYLFVGGLATFQSAAGIFAMLLVGKLSDKSNQVQLFKKLGVFSAIIWFLTFFISSPIMVAIFSFLIGLTYVSFIIPTFAFVCNDSYHDHMVELMAYREFILAIAKVGVFSIALLLPFKYLFKMMFLIAAIASLIILSFSERKK